MATLTVLGSLNSLDDIRAFVSEHASMAGLTERQTYRLCLAVDEIATNIVNYGYVGSGQKGVIDVQVDVSDSDVTVKLIDDSPAYDPFSHKDPDNLDAPLEERAIGGLGIFLASENVDKFSYEYIDGRNHNIFMVNRNGRA